MGKKYNEITEALNQNMIPYKWLQKSILDIVESKSFTQITDGNSLTYVDNYFDCDKKLNEDFEWNYVSFFIEKGKVKIISGNLIYESTGARGFRSGDSLTVYHQEINLTCMPKQILMETKESRNISGCTTTNVRIFSNAVLTDKGEVNTCRFYKMSKVLSRTPSKRTQLEDICEMNPSLLKYVNVDILRKYGASIIYHRVSNEYVTIGERDQVNRGEEAKMRIYIGDNYKGELVLNDPELTIEMIKTGTSRKPMLKPDARVENHLKRLMLTK